tara:strand:+ start:471 stop:686 length:216 start_codon:yes stop_codon:yes gene_type:complete
MIVRAIPDKKIRKLLFFGIEILEFFNNKCHLHHNANQPHVTNDMIIGKNSILKLEILSDIVLISDAIRNTA